MNFELINQLSESAVFRTDTSVDKFNLKDLSLLFYLYILSSYILMQEDSTSTFIQHYCSKTKAFNNFDFFRPSATDFYIIAFVLTGNNSKYHGTPEILKYQKISSSDFLSFLTSIISNSQSSWYQSYFYTLESRLKISNSGVRECRRSIINWKDLQFKEKEKIIDILYSRIKSLAPSSEILDSLRKLISNIHTIEENNNQDFLYESTLVENRYEYLLKTYGEKILDTALKNQDINADYSEVSDEYLEQEKRLDTKHMLRKLEALDISPNKQYLQWIVLRYIAGNFRIEDHVRVKNALNSFFRYKNRLPQKDINQYKGVADLEDAVEPFIGKKSQRQLKKIQKKKLIKCMMMDLW
jgi:hypothetical protein